MSNVRKLRRSQRRSRRYKVTLNQSVCFTLNVGDGGFCAGIVRVLPPGTDVEGTIDINGTAVPFKGTIAWATAGEPRLGARGRMGIRFDKPGLHVAAAPTSADGTVTATDETTVELPISELAHADEGAHGREAAASPRTGLAY